jgi:hypothetical protein
MNKYLLLSLLLLVACNDDPPVHTVCPDGSKCMIVNCDWISDDTCIIARGKACPSGYDVMGYNLIKCHPKLEN